MSLNIQKTMADPRFRKALETIVEFNNFYGPRDWNKYSWKQVEAVTLTKGKVDGTEWFRIEIAFPDKKQNFYSQLETRDDWNTMSTSGYTGGNSDEKFKPTTKEHIVYLKQFADLF